MMGGHGFSLIPPASCRIGGGGQFALRSGAFSDPIAAAFYRRSRLTGLSKAAAAAGSSRATTDYSRGAAAAASGVFMTAAKNATLLMIHDHQNLRAARDRYTR